MLLRYVGIEGSDTSTLLWFDDKSSEESGGDWCQGCAGDSRLARKCLLDEGGGESARGDYGLEKKVQSQNDLPKGDIE